MFQSSNLNGIVWLPDAEAVGSLAITNSGRSRRTIQLTVGAEKSEIVLFGHQSRLVKLNEAADRAASPQLISLHHDGLPGDIIAGGFVLTKGYSATIPMVDPTVMRSSRLAGAHVRFGELDGREGFSRLTRFSAPLLLANLGKTPVNAQVSIDYTVQGKEEEISNERIKKPMGVPKPSTDKASTVAAKKCLTIRPGEVELIELSSLAPAGPVKDGGVDVTYDASPGTVIGQLTNVDASGDYSFEVPIKDPSALDMTFEGDYPWTINSGRNTSVYLKNTTDKVVHAYPNLAFPDGSFMSLPLVELQPYQTFAIDVQKVKDSKQADSQGRRFPVAATQGQLIWNQEIPYSIVGRAETVSLKDGIASSFTCGNNCNCSFVEEQKDFEPPSYGGVPGDWIYPQAW